MTRFFNANPQHIAEPQKPTTIPGALHFFLGLALIALSACGADEVPLGAALDTTESKDWSTQPVDPPDTVIPAPADEPCDQQDEIQCIQSDLCVPSYTDTCAGCDIVPGTCDGVIFAGCLEATSCTTPIPDPLACPQPDGSVTYPQPSPRPGWVCAQVNPDCRLDEDGACSAPGCAMVNGACRPNALKRPESLIANIQDKLQGTWWSRPSCGGSLAGTFACFTNVIRFEGNTWTSYGTAENTPSSFSIDATLEDVAPGTLSDVFEGTYALDVDPTTGVLRLIQTSSMRMLSIPTPATGGDHLSIAQACGFTGNRSSSDARYLVKAVDNGVVSDACAEFQEEDTFPNAPLSQVIQTITFSRYQQTNAADAPETQFLSLRPDPAEDAPFFGTVGVQLKKITAENTQSRSGGSAAPAPSASGSSAFTGPLPQPASSDDI